MNDSKKIDNGASSQGYWKMVRKQLFKNRIAKYSIRFIVVLIVFAACADIIANEKPLACNYQGHVYFPVFKSYLVSTGISEWPAEVQNVEWKKLNYQWVVFPPIPYLPQNIDEANVHSVGPFDKQQVRSIHWRHWLGTDELGHDILAAMIYGTRIAMLVGIVSMGIAAIIGLIMGLLAGYFGDDRLKLTRAQIIFNLLFIMLGIFYAFGLRSYALSDALASSFISFLLQLMISILILIIMLCVGNVLAMPFKKVPFLGRKVSIPVDIIVSRCIEVMMSIPTLFLIMAIIAVAKPSVILVMVVIGATAWTGIARFVRAELLRIRELEYIEAAHALGYSEIRTVEDPTLIYALLNYMHFHQQCFLQIGLTLLAVWSE